MNLTTSGVAYASFRTVFVAVHDEAPDIVQIWTLEVTWFPLTSIAHMRQYRPLYIDFVDVGSLDDVYDDKESCIIRI